MSDFIPMVSTTPPPIDDDFGDFMDSGNHDDGFADFSSPTEYDEYSYPSVNSPPIITSPMGYESEDTNGFNKALDPNDTFNEVMEEKENDKEVEKVLSHQKLESDLVKSADNLSMDGSFESVQYNGIKKPRVSGDELSDDWLVEQIDEDEKITISNEADHVPMPESPKGLDERVEYSESVSTNLPESQSNMESNKTASSYIDSTDAAFATMSIDTSRTDHEENISEDEEFCVLSVENCDPPEFISDRDNDEFQNTSSDNKHPDASEQHLHDVAAKSPQPELNNEQFSEIHSDIDSIETKTIETVQLDDLEPQKPSAVHSDVSFDKMADSSMEFSVQCQTAIDSDKISPTPSDNERNSEDDFADFSEANQSRSLKAKLEDDSFADFGSFETQSVEEPDTVKVDEGSQPSTDEFSLRETSDANDPDDGFADFSDVVAADSATFVSETEQDSEFADFSTSNGPDDDFNAFDSSSTSDWASFSTTVAKELTVEEKVISFISKYSSEKGSNEVNEIVPHLDEHLRNDTLSKGVESPTTSVESTGIVWSGDLWDQLEDIDNTIALSFVWNGSRHNKHLLDALGMHTQNILFSGTKQAYYVPAYYAAGLGMVDPSKGILKPMSAAEKITAMSPTDKNHPHMEDIPAEESHPEWKTVAGEPTSGKGMNVASSWLRTDVIIHNQDDSEISSPSKTVPMVSSTMDLDYFDNLPGAKENMKPSGGADLIDPELLELTSAPSTEPPPPPKDSGSATLSKILATIKGDGNSGNPGMSVISSIGTQDNTRWEEEESRLSCEARSVLQKLPDLSYMRSKVLIFPVNMSRVNIGDS